MNFGRNFAKFGDFGHARIFLTNEIQNSGKNHIIRLCHYAEASLYKKICTIVLSFVQKESTTGQIHCRMQFCLVSGCTITVAFTPLQVMYFLKVMYLSMGRIVWRCMLELLNRGSAQWLLMIWLPLVEPFLLQSDFLVSTF